MNKILSSIMLLATISFASCSSNSNSNSKSEPKESKSVEEKIVNEPIEEVVIEEKSDPIPEVYCHACGSAINGSPYEAFGRVFCDMGCYADDNMN
jgi:hypothetical protein